MHVGKLFINVFFPFIIGKFNFVFSSNSMVLLKCAEEFMYSIPCLQKHTPMLLDYFRTGTSSISDIMCGEYNDQTDSCMRLGKAPKPVKKLKQIKYVTPMALLIDLMESIHNVTSSPTLQFK